MTTAIPRSTYSRGSIAFHWIIALLVFLNFYIGLFHDDWAKETKSFWMGQHKAIGVTVILLTIGRLIWRVMHKAPEPLPTHSQWERRLAWIAHRLFYVLLIIVPLTGWLMSSAAGRPVNMFGLFEISLPVTQDRAAADTYGERHEMLAFVMLGLVALHIIGALKHHFMDKDLTLGRMIPFLNRAK